MTTETGSESETRPLEIALGPSRLPVSYLSSLLRVLQAAMREVARSNDGTAAMFSQQPQPVLVVSTATVEGDLVLRFTFGDPLDSTPLTNLSSLTFKAFLEQFSQLVKELPQRSLWGESVGGARPRYASGVERRLDQVRLELRRFPKARLSFDRHTISFEDDRMEIG